jgi:uncharacterized protein YbjT (DUF2867 family)
MILVMGANGNQGRTLVPKFKEAGLRVRAFRSSGDAQSSLDLGADEVVFGNAADRSSLKAALEGVTTVYHISPTAHPMEREMGFAMVDTAREAGGIHLIFSSVLHTIASKLPQHKCKRDIEEHLVESGVDFTILKPADYMMPGMYDATFATGKAVIPFWMGRLQAMVHLDDIADVAARVAVEREMHFGASYELVSQVVTPEDIVKAAENVMGTALESSLADADSFFELAFPDSTPVSDPYRYSLLHFIQTWYKVYDFPGNTNVLTYLLGRPPHTLLEFVQGEFKRFKQL